MVTEENQCLFCDFGSEPCWISDGHEPTRFQDFRLQF